MGIGKGGVLGIFAALSRERAYSKLEFFERQKSRRLIVVAVVERQIIKRGIVLRAGKGKLLHIQSRQQQFLSACIFPVKLFY